MGSTEDRKSTYFSKQLFKEFEPVSRQEWEAKIKEDLNGKDFRKLLNWHPIDELNIEPFYRREDVQDLEHIDQQPGQFPFVRGSQTTGNQWKVREHIEAHHVEKAKNSACQAIDMGAESISFRMRPHPSEGMLGGDLEGVSVQKQNDLSSVLENIDLSSISLYFDTGMATPAYLAMLHNVAQEQNLSNDNPEASFSFDPFSFAISHGKWPSEPSHFEQIAAGMVDFSNEHLPNARPLSINLQPYHYGGATDVQELGIAMAIGQAYLARLTDRGCYPTDIAGHLHFYVPVGTSYFLEIAKLRALRLLWSRILEEYLTENEVPSPAVVHTETSTYMHSIYDSYNNMVRNTSQALSAIIGGCNSLAVIPHNNEFDQPATFARRIARNVQHIMREESHLDKVADPAGGAYYIEKLTDELAKHAWKFFQEIEKQGGFVRAIEGGFIQSEIARACRKRTENLATGQTTIVGVNNFPNPEENMLGYTTTNYTASSLMQSDVQPEFNLDEPIEKLAETFENGAFIGDVINLLVNPTRQYLQTINPHRAPQPFEKLRLQTEQFEKNTSQRPSVLLIPMGDPALRKQRANFASNLLGCAGYQIVEPLSFEDTDQALNKIKEEPPDMAVICAPDDLYKDIVSDLSPQIQNLEKTPLLAVAGNPGKLQEDLQGLNIDHYIYSGMNGLQLLQKLHHQFGVVSDTEKDSSKPLKTQS